MATMPGAGAAVLKSGRVSKAPERLQAGSTKQQGTRAERFARAAAVARESEAASAAIENGLCAAYTEVKSPFLLRHRARVWHGGAGSPVVAALQAATRRNKPLLDELRRRLLDRRTNGDGKVGNS